MPKGDAVGGNNTERGSVAYVLKGYPRISELFIASEIYRLEQLGLQVRLYVLKPREEREQHPVIARIRARAEYLPETTSLSSAPFHRWLRTNLPAFVPDLRRTAGRRPAGLARAAAAALAQSLRARQLWWSWPKKVFLRDFLLGVALASRLLEASDVRHLHAHFAHGATTVTWFAATITGLQFSFTGHAKDVYSESLNPAGLLRRKLLAARFAVTCTEANRRHLTDVARDAVVHCVYHGLNADFARLTARADGMPGAASDGILRPLGVGRLVPKKGFDVLIHSCAVLARRGVAFETTIVGEDGEHGEEIRALIRRLGLESRVLFEGVLGQAELFDRYKSATALCLPCRVLENGDRDGIPNVLLEAMASGLPVVTTAVSGIPELVVDNENGLIVPPEDPEALADALVRLQADKALVLRLGQAAQATVRNAFDGERQARELAALLQAAIQ